MSVLRPVVLQRREQRPIINQPQQRVQLPEGIQELLCGNQLLLHRVGKLVQIHHLDQTGGVDEYVRQQICKGEGIGSSIIFGGQISQYQQIRLP